jgi:demethylmenaquinone methyltransferase/2-methoxy-6-polyprenyl-1,4-benzoquinol methylase
MTTGARPNPARPAWTTEDLAGNPHEADDKADRVRSMFAAIARSYDLNNRLHSFGRDQAWRRAAVHLAGIGPNDDVLDVACGTGDLAEAFAEAGPRSVTGVDFTEPMLAIARRKADQRPRGRDGVGPVYRHGDAMALEFDDASFDVVSIAFGIRNVAEPDRAFGEFRRVLRPGGRLVVLEFSEPENPILRIGSRFYTRHVMPWTATLLARDRSGAYRYLPRSVGTFMDRGELMTRLDRSGFEVVASRPLTFGVCVAYVAHVRQSR